MDSRGDTYDARRSFLVFEKGQHFHSGNLGGSTWGIIHARYDSEIQSRPVRPVPGHEGYTWATLGINLINRLQDTVGCWHSSVSFMDIASWIMIKPLIYLRTTHNYIPYHCTVLFWLLVTLALAEIEGFAYVPALIYACEQINTRMSKKWEKRRVVVYFPEFMGGGNGAYRHWQRGTQRTSLIVKFCAFRWSIQWVALTITTCACYRFTVPQKATLHFSHRWDSDQPELSARNLNWESR